MTEQNNVQTPQQPVPAQPTMQPVNNVAQPVAPANPAPQQPVAPAAPVQPAAQPAPSTSAPAPAPVSPAQPVAPAQPAPVQNPAPVAEPAPAAQPAPAQPAPTPVVAQPSTPVQADIAPSAPLNPLENAQPQTPAFSSAPTPAVPMSPAPVTAQPGGTNFVPNAEPLKKKSNKGLIIGIVVAVVAVLAVVGYFVIYPLIMKNMITPNKVYENTINAVFKEITTTVEDVVHDKAIYSFDAKIDSNMPTISSFSGYTYGINVGVDPTKEALQAGLYMKNANADYSLWGYIKDGKQYTRYSTDNKLNYIGELSSEEHDELFGALKEALEAQGKADAESINYVINKINELVLSSIKEDKLTQEEATITVNKENIKVLNNKYVLDEATMKATVKHIVDGLKADKKAVTNLATLLGVKEEEVTQMLTYEESEEDDGVEYTTMIVNIYTTNKAELVGFAITDEKGNNDIHYYKNGGSFELEYYEKTEDTETNKDIENTLSIVGVEKGGKTNVTVTFNKEKIATLVINKNTETELDLDYTVILGEEQNVTGSLAIKVDEGNDKSRYTYDFSMKAAEQYINVTLDISLDWTTQVANINTGEAVTVTEAELALKDAAFIEALANTPIGALFQTMGGDTSAGINDYYSDSYYEMMPGDNVDTSDVIFQDTTLDSEVIELG